MLQTIRRCLQPNLNQNRLNRRSFNSLSQQPQNIYSINQVRVSGQIDDLFINENGIVICYLKSNFKNGKFLETHKIRFARNISDFVKDKLRPGKTICVTGKLDIVTFTAENSKQRQTGTIVANKMYLCEDSAVAIQNDPDIDAESENQVTLNENHVELLGMLVSDVKTFNSCKSFTLSVNRSPRADDATPQQNQFNRIFVYNKNLFPLLDSVRHRDFFLVNGKLSYKREIDIDGRNQNTCNIIAKQLYRITN